MPLIPSTKVAQWHRLDLTVRNFGDLRLHHVFKGDGNGRWTARNHFGGRRFSAVRFGFIHFDATLQQQRLARLRPVQSPLPVIPFVKACQPGVQDHLCRKARLDVAGENRAVADLRRDRLIDRQQWALASGLPPVYRG